MRRFVVEGPKLVIEALDSPLAVHQVVVPADVDPDPAIVERCRDVPLHGVDARAFHALAGTRAPQPALAMVDAPALDLDARLLAAGPRRLLLLVDVADPGNVGTLIRTAEASGFAGVIAAGSTADVLSPKTVRASAGSVLRLPLAEAETVEAMARLDEVAFSTVGASLGGTPYDRVRYDGARVALVLGSEAHGLDEAIIDRCTHVASIPMAGDVESLNVATAGAVLAFDLARRARAPVEVDFSGESTPSPRA